MDSNQANTSLLGNFKSELVMNPPKTPLYVTQEALSMLEADLNISSLNRHKTSKSNSVFLTRTNKLSDLTTGEPYVRHDHFYANSMKEHLLKSELLDGDQKKICMFSIHLNEIVSIDDRKRFDLSHVNNDITYFKNTRLSNNELISTKILQPLNGSFPETINSSKIYPYFDEVDGLGTKFPQSGLLYNSPNTETPNLPMFEMSSQTSITKDNFSSSRRFAVRDVSSSIVRHHSESCGSTQKTDVMPKTKKRSTFKVNCHHNKYTQCCSVGSAPEDMHYCVCVKPKRSSFKKWFKLRLPKSNFSSKSHTENKLFLFEGDISDSKHVFKEIGLPENISLLKNRNYNSSDGDNGTFFTTEPGRKLSTDKINKPFGRIHHPPFTNVCAQLFSRLFRQNEPSSSSFLSSGFFPRMQKLSANTIRRGKRSKQNGRKFDKISTQCSIAEQEKFQFLPLYTRQRSPKSSHFEKDELTENEGSLLVKQIVQSISDKSDDSWNTDSSENGSSKTPLVNSKTWPIDSPNVKVSNKIARLYRGLIETIESGEFIKSTSQTWKQIQFSNNTDNLPQDGVACNLRNCTAKNSSETSEIHDGFKAQDINHSLIDDTTQYPYAKYVAAMIDALSERLMGKISEDDLEFHFQTLEAEASKVAAKPISQPVVKRERFYSVSNEVRSSRYRNSLQNALGNASSDEKLLTNMAGIGKLENERCHSFPIFHTMTNQSNLHDVVPPSVESSHRCLKHCCLAQVKRLKLRNKVSYHEQLSY
ncbi:hypothetical protein KSF78_0004145 [Schistosoma japonicum]|nr:hypothetical protein KSF78_0004145 [Schistosoma japonicum]